MKSIDFFASRFLLIQFNCFNQYTSIIKVILKQILSINLIKKLKKHNWN